MQPRLEITRDMIDLYTYLNLLRVRIPGSRIALPNTRAANIIEIIYIATHIFDQPIGSTSIAAIIRQNYYEFIRNPFVAIPVAVINANSYTRQPIIEHIDRGYKATIRFDSG